ncbi:hypothetical protein TNCV_940071 [Trichonephila clavipes]|nr:hypothetical protein TNCV_940071 [Trichonephila clavipes]
MVKEGPSSLSIVPPSGSNCLHYPMAQLKNVPLPCDLRGSTEVWHSSPPYQLKWNPVCVSSDATNMLPIKHPSISDPCIPSTS